MAQGIGSGERVNDKHCVRCGIPGHSSHQCKREVLPVVPVWPQDKAACYGVNCRLHSKCARYWAVENNTNQRQVFIATCEDSDLFVEMK